MVKGVNVSKKSSNKRKSCLKGINPPNPYKKGRKITFSVTSLAYPKELITINGTEVQNIILVDTIFKINYPASIQSSIEKYIMIAEKKGKQDLFVTNFI